MSKSPSKESDIPPLSHIGSSVERHSSDAHRIVPVRYPQGLKFFSAALPESSLQGTIINLQSALALLLSRMDRMESNIANVTKTISLL